MRTTKNIPGPQGHFLLGNIKAFKREPLACMIAWQKQYGDFVHFKLGPRNVYMLSHPDFIEQTVIKHPDVFIKMYDPKKPKGLALVLGQGLVTSQGELWRKQRRLMQPVFHRSKVFTMLPQMLTAGEGMLLHWDQRPDEEIINISEEMMKLTLEVITQTMFSTSVLHQIDEIAPALDIGLRYAAKTALNPLVLPLSIPTPGNRKFLQARRRLDCTIGDLIKQRRIAGTRDADLLDRLIAARDPETGGTMDDQQIKDEVTTIFSAGHETTANALTWTLYLLAKHPNVLNKVRRELEQALNGVEITEQNLQQLNYLRAVFEESMRFRPPVGFIMRKLKRDFSLDGFQLQANSLVIFNIYGLHHHPDFWTQAEHFNPDRFLRGDYRKYSYMPFGSGERFCIGKHFAMTEGLALLALILKQYDFSLLDNKEPKMEMAVTIRPKGGLKLRLRKLDN